LQVTAAVSHARFLWRYLLVVAAVGVAVWAQWALFTQKLAADGVILFSASAVLFGLAVLPGQRLVKPASALVEWGLRPRTSVTSHRSAMLIAAAGCAALTWIFSGGNLFRPETILFWFSACGFYVCALWERRADHNMRLGERVRGLAATSQFTFPWTAVGLALVVALGAFLRYYQIAAVPADPTSDIAEKLLDVRDLQNGQYHIFFPRNTGREPIEFYMALPFVQMFGLTHLALKVLTATVSLLTIPLVFLLGREIVDSRFGLLAAFFLAISKWDIAIGRVGLRFPYYPLFVALAFLFLLRALRRRSRNDFLLCGLATGVGLYGYSPFRAMVLLIPIAVLLWLAFHFREGREGKEAVLFAVKNTALCVGTIAVAFIPLAHYMFENPAMFWFRALTRVSGTESQLPPNPLGVLLSNVSNALLMFNWRGDVVWVNTIPYDPVLDYVSGGLFLLGIGWCIFSLTKQREPVAAYLLAALFALLLPSILSLSFPGENPSVVRTGGATPIVALLVAAPVYLSWKRMRELWPGRLGRTATALLLVAVLALAARVNFDRYFTDYPAQYNQSSVNSTEMAAVIEGFSRSIGSHQNVYIKSWPYWVDTRNVAFCMRDPSWNNVLMTTEDVLRHQPPQGNRLYIINPADKDAVATFQQRFPEGQLRTEKSATPGKDFIVFFVPAQP
jgi:hypothetical protein